MAITCALRCLVNTTTAASTACRGLLVNTTIWCWQAASWRGLRGRPPLERFVSNPIIKFVRERRRLRPQSRRPAALKFTKLAVGNRALVLARIARGVRQSSQFVELCSIYNLEMLYPPVAANQLPLTVSDGGEQIAVRHVELERRISQELVRRRAHFLGDLQHHLRATVCGCVNTTTVNTTAYSGQGLLLEIGKFRLYRPHGPFRHFASQLETRPCVNRGR